MHDKKVFDRVRDCFSNVYVGGSYGRKLWCESKDIEPYPGDDPMDIDFFILGNTMTREVVKHLIETFIFKEDAVAYMSNEFPGEEGLPGNPSYYRMPFIRKRITVEVMTDRYESDCLRYDFVFLEPTAADLETLSMFNSSWFSQFFAKLDFSYPGYSFKEKYCVPAFKYLGTGIDGSMENMIEFHGLKVSTDYRMATTQHIGKLKKLFLDNPRVSYVDKLPNKVQEYLDKRHQRPF